MTAGAFDLSGTAAIVTGANKGIGQAVALALAGVGADIALVGRSRADETAAQVRALGRRAVLIEADLGSVEPVQRIVGETLAALGRLDILVNNAGIIRRADAVDTSEADWDAVIDTDLKSLFFLCQAAGRHMIGQGRGKIVNIASLLSFQGGIRVPAYAAAKSGVAGLTRALANEWAGKGVNVNAIAPGYIATDNTEALRADEARNRQIIERIPAGRWGAPSDIGGAALFLASPASDYVNGHILSVDGGWLGRVISRRAALAGLAASPLLLSTRAWAETVDCPAGRFEGRLEGGVRVFKGIDYGRAERFRAPVAAPRVAGVVRAMDYGPSCPQTGRSGLQVDEQCLFLNIWAPAGSEAHRRPVMLYFHGGAYSTGTPVSPMLDGSRLAVRGDAVVVTVAHRLNAFGYLYLARLDPRFPDSGNAGQLDLILALRWVRDNIAAFGGDPNRIMVFGQSGGGAKIATLMGTPAARGLFHRAATMSGQQVTASGPLHATERARAYMARLGARSADDLLAMPAERLVEGLAATDPVLGGGVYMGPVLDMKWLVRHPFWPDANPQGNAIPMMLGNTHDETRAFYPPDDRRIIALNWDNLAERMAPELRIDALPEWVVAEYRRMFPAYDATQIFYAATTAGRSWRGQVIEAEERARAGVPGFVYQLNFPSPAPHASDIPLVFGTYADPAARPVSEAMMAAFLRFARTGDPGWAPYTLPARRTMIFDRAPHMESDPRRAERELFARIPYIQPGT